jgi:hypothetical protein
MQGFQRTVLIVAAVMLVIALVVIGMMIRSAVTEVEWPPQTSTCPDYWLESARGICTTSHGQNGGVSSGTLNVAGKGMATPQQRCDWARKNKVMWDGITDAAFCQ